MKVAVNDLSFGFPLFTREDALNKVRQFIHICRELESNRCHNVEKLLTTEVDKQTEIYPGCNLYNILNALSDREEKRYFLSLLVDRENIRYETETQQRFEFKGLSSYICACMHDDAVVSLETLDEFTENQITGMIGGDRVSIKNISREGHLCDYRISLGIRIYEANEKKHKRDRENAYGKDKPGSKMDIEGKEAQELLDKAICVNGRLYARKRNQNYAFQKTSEGIYHGYAADDLPVHVVAAIAEAKWD